MHTIEELRERQALPLYLKLAMTKTRIRDWVNEYGEDGVYISFSGGKDSTVLLDIVRNQCGYNIPAVFVDIPTQYPELRSFVKTFDNVDIIKPKMNFFEVCSKYGFPLISKEVANAVYDVKSAIRKGNPAPKYRMDKFNGTKINKKTGKKSQYNFPKWKFLLDSPFDISHMCCNIMKKNPVKRYEKQTGRVPILAMMAEESKLREQSWLKTGCNAFDAKRPSSNPMSFWTEQDVLLYIKENNLPICSVYGDIITDDEEWGQMQFSDYGYSDFEIKNPRLHCTGCQRTGCVLCGFGAHMPDDKRFLLLKESHPKMYQFLDIASNNGYTMQEAIDWINKNGSLNIRY